MKRSILKVVPVLVIFSVFILFLPAGQVFSDTVSTGEMERKLVKPATASPWFPPLVSEPYSTGNWEGMRDKLADTGVTVTSSYVGDFLGNPSGGREQGVGYDHSWGLDINVDLEKAAGWEGLQFHVSGLWRNGVNLSQKKIGNAFTVTSIYGSEELKFYGLYLDQALFDKKVHVRIGRISPGDDFAASPVYWIYVNNAIDGNPVSLPINLPFITYPTAVWGVRARIDYSDLLYSQHGIYAADSRVGRDSAHGVDFSLRLARGFGTAHEIAFTPGAAKDSTWLPGNYKAGFYYHSGVTRELLRDRNNNSYVISGLDPAKHVGNYNFYCHADQMIYREGEPGSDQGLSIFTAATFGPDSLNQFPFFIDGGIFYKGPIPGRDDDIAAFGTSYGLWSRDLARAQADRRDITGTASLDPQEYELMLEFTYKAMILPYFYFQPDVQYIIHPGGTGNYRNALVMGLRMGVTF
jgi:porin